MAAHSVRRAEFGGGYAIRNEEDGSIAAYVDDVDDKDTATFIAWALAYREHLWYDLCQCADGGNWPVWIGLNPYSFVCTQCGGYLLKLGKEQDKK